MDMYVVIGGGSAGYVAGSVLGREGKEVVVIEKGKFGGVCVNSGCVPSIFLSDISFLFSRLNEIGNYKGLEISVTDSKGNFFSKRNEIIEYLSNAGKELVKNSGAEVIEGEAKIVSPNEVEVEGKRISFDKLIIATGSIPLKPSIKGIERAISEDEAVNLNYVPSSLVVIGGGYAGVEIAQIYARLGSEVTLITRGKIMKYLDEDGQKIIKDSLEWDGVELIENCEVEEIREQEVVTKKGMRKKGEIVVYATGRKPNFPKGIDKLGIKYNDNGIVVNDLLQTTNSRVYSAGDVIDKEKKVAHVAMLEGIISALNSSGKMERIDYFSVPQVVYTDPQIGIVGNRKLAVKECKFPLSATTRAIIKGLREGYAKIGVDEKGKIVYGEVVADVAEELVNELAIAIKAGMTCKDLALTALVHPSLSESMINACRGFFNLDVDRFKDKNA
ncbi:dihydrolipoyl dehydrogenase family protein [Acidianus ambivalens]|uniref:Pyridine nucleotide-disulfide oxidoreductase n=1 Tax=Acidianus ambivalens TaxID=2283 RepID=A0A650CTM3_ACIAM|nr:NAD(P)/FAD-dependent oxidoreductase [Acidianus ambivalens]MQL56275.1 pyridine nucleotide-disulfide oxidoreductase [Acidianus ambivalens]QGR21190.1 pyridine nucleotide-disulfide oxidoreductase [Acidianus ambivalens]